MMFCQFLVGFTDVWVAGRIHRDVQAVLGIVVQCQFLLLIVGVAIANGSIAAISQSLGAGLLRRAERYGGLILKYGLGFSFIVLAAGMLFRRWIFAQLHIPVEILPLAERFWFIFLLVLPSNYLLALSGAIFRARRFVVIPMFSALLACVINAFFSLGLGLGWWGLPQLGADGIALATFCSVTVMAIFNIVMLRRGNILSRRAFSPWKWERRALPYLLQVAAPSGGMQLLWHLGYLVLFSITASLPQDRVNALAGMTAGMRVESLLFLPAFAFSMTASMLVGHCLGSGDTAEAKRVGLRIMAAGCALLSLAALLLWPWIGHIAALVAPDPDARDHALAYLRFNLLATPFSAASMVMGGIMTGAGATIYTLAVFGAAIWLVRLPAAWYLGHVLWQNSSGVFFAMFLSQVFQAGIVVYIFHARNWTRFAMRKIKLHPQE